VPRTVISVGMPVTVTPGDDGGAFVAGIDRTETCRTYLVWFAAVIDPGGPT
jgi:hypothetical protein